MSVRLELNDEIRDALRIPPEEQEGRLRRELALRLYERGTRSAFGAETRFPFVKRKD
jgi:hypothetical protein